jgi:hypothetical protein
MEKQLILSYPSPSFQSAYMAIRECEKLYTGAPVLLFQQGAGVPETEITVSYHVPQDTKLPTVEGVILRCKFQLIKVEEEKIIFYCWDADDETVLFFDLICILQIVFRLQFITDYFFEAPPEIFLNDLENKLVVAKNYDKKMELFSFVYDNLNEDMFKNHGSLNLLQSSAFIHIFSKSCPHERVRRIFEWFENKYQEEDCYLVAYNVANIYCLVFCCADYYYILNGEILDGIWDKFSHSLSAFVQNPDQNIIN